MSDHGPLQGLSAIVTGSGRGIGAATALWPDPISRRRRRRRAGRAAIAACAVAFFAGDVEGFYTNTYFPVDGGMTT